MRVKNKTVQFDHFQVYYAIPDGNNNLVESVYNLNALLHRIANSPLIGTQREIYGDFYRFHKCNYIEEYHVWELQILRLRDKILPGIADSEGAYEIIKLADNEIPAESTTLLYDGINNTLYMQKKHVWSISKWHGELLKGTFDRRYHGNTEGSDQSKHY